MKALFFGVFVYNKSFLFLRLYISNKNNTILYSNEKDWQKKMCMGMGNAGFPSLP